MAVNVRLRKRDLNLSSSVITIAGPTLLQLHVGLVLLLVCHNAISVLAMRIPLADGRTADQPPWDGLLPHPVNYEHDSTQLISRLWKITVPDLTNVMVGNQIELRFDRLTADFEQLDETEKAKMNKTMDFACCGESPGASFISVVAVGEKVIFTGKPHTRILGSPPSRDTVYFTITPKKSGSYRLFLEEVADVLKSPTKSQFQIGGSPFVMQVNDPSGTPEDSRFQDDADMLPSCQTLPRDADVWTGADDGQLGGQVWVRKELASPRHGGALRLGWIVQPKSCTMDVLSKQMLKNYAASTGPIKTVVVMGSSTDRGIFLSLVDILLTREEKRNFVQSHFTKCWGYAEVRVGRLRVIYQDARVSTVSSEIVPSDGTSWQHNKVLCHNDKEVGNEAEYMQNDLKFFKETLFGDDDRVWPDVIMFEPGCDREATSGTQGDVKRYLTCDHSLSKMEAIASHIPAHWNGTLLPLSNFGPKYERAQYLNGALGWHNEDIAARFKALSQDMPPWFHPINALPLITAVRHSCEQDAPWILGGNHFHKTLVTEELNTHYDKISHHQTDVINVGHQTELLAQVALAFALAPNGLSEVRRLLPAPEGARDITVCYDCPHGLLPFHIKSKPELTCYTDNVIQGTELTDQKWPVFLKHTSCPSSCMAQDPVRLIQTQSTAVEERSCQI